MHWLLTALGLVLILEGLAWALVPHLVRQLLETLFSLPQDRLRMVGAGTVCLGVVSVIAGRFLA